MSRRIDDTSAETFWPGYVDAVTNLVLSLLFVLVIMTVAVFMFALELGRTQPKKPPAVPHDRPPVSMVDAPAGQVAVNESSGVRDVLREKDAQLASMQERIRTLESEARQRSKAQAPTDSRSSPPVVSAGGSGTSSEPTRVVTATAPIPAAERGLEKTVPVGPAGGIIVKFADDAIALTRNEAEDLRTALAQVLASGGARLEVVVPTGFSEARRLGFYRAMAVRNELIQLKMPANRIDISVRDGSAGSDSSRVMVSPR
jgi:hypothetical protein